MSDLISRQAAIIQLSHNKIGDDDHDVVVQKDIETIKQLPSAEPQIIQCKDCKHYKYGMCMKICANKSTNGFCDWGER